MAILVGSYYNLDKRFSGYLMAQPSLLQHSPLRKTLSPDISVTSCDAEKSPAKSENRILDSSSLAPPPNGSKGTDSDSRYFTASSGEDYDFDDDDDDDGLCIRLDSDDNDSQSLSGLHINLKTLQAVSTMLAHYNPIIQSDKYGNPTFVAPPPPPEEDFHDEPPLEGNTPNHTSLSPARGTENSRLWSDMSHDSTLTGEDDYQCALQELEDVLLGQEQTLFSDAMTELTDVMEKMTQFTAETDDEDDS